MIDKFNLFFLNLLLNFSSCFEPVLYLFKTSIPTILDRSIEVLNVNPQHKKAIILWLYQNDIKVLKDALAC